VKSPDYSSCGKAVAEVVTAKEMRIMPSENKEESSLAIFTPHFYGAALCAR